MATEYEMHRQRTMYLRQLPSGRQKGHLLRSRIQAHRKKKNWTIRRLSAISGVAYKLVWDMEHGFRPRLTNAYKVASAFGLTVYELWDIPHSGPDVDAVEFESDLRGQREARGWSLDTFAAMSGVPKNTIYRIENGQVPNLASAARIAAALGVSVYQLWKPPSHAVTG